MTPGRHDVGDLPASPAQVLVRYLTTADLARSPYDADGACIYCRLKTAGQGGSTYDRSHDAQCPLVLERVRRAAHLPTHTTATRQ